MYVYVCGIMILSWKINIGKYMIVTHQKTRIHVQFCVSVVRYIICDFKKNDIQYTNTSTLVIC